MNTRSKHSIIVIIICCTCVLAVLVSLPVVFKMAAQAASPLWDGSVASSFAGGTGTEQDPYLINNGAQLAYFSQRVNSGTTYAGQYIRLTQDILLNEMNADGTFVEKENKLEEFTSIGKLDKRFQGHFDGNGKTIIGLYINKDWSNYWCGLFGYAAGGSEIKNVSISGSVKGGMYTGAVAGYTNGVITGCAVNATVIGVQSHNGGVAGYADTNSAITNCTVTKTVQGRYYAGGIAAYTNGVINGCTVNTSVSASEQYAGGIASYAGANSVISDCTVSGTVQSCRYYAGGVAGLTEAGITDCTVNGTVTAGGWYAGGIAGYTSGAASEITNCSVSGTVQGQQYAGGVAGWTAAGIADCTVNGTVKSTDNYAGGIAGYAAGAANEIMNCAVSGTVQGRSYVGGMAGQTEASITDCTLDGTVTAVDNYVGGIAGYAADQSVISDSSASGNVSGRYYVGGVVGRTDETVTGCSSVCTVAGLENYIGGVAGYAATGSEVSNSSSSGNVSGRYYIGGVVGYTDGLVSVCINDGGSVTGIEQYIGGIAGYADNGNTVSNCFNSGDVSGRDSIGGIVGSGNWSDGGSTINNNLSIGDVTGSTNVGGIVGYAQSSLTPSNAWNNYYANAPGGTGGGDVWNMDGAVPIGSWTWEQVTEHLNNNNPAGDDIWSEDQEGIPLPGIFVPKDPVEVTNARIKEGRYYTAAPLGNGVSAAVTADSVFTVAFSMRYNEAYQLATQTLGLANETTVVPLPANTSIIMLVDGVYYYKNLSAELGTKLALSEFIKMGSTTEQYAPAEPAPADATKEYLFIFDFSKTTPGVAAGACKVELMSSAGTCTGTPPSVTVEGENTYSLTVSGSDSSLEVNLSKTPVMDIGYDYKTDGKSYAYELHLEQGVVTAPWPIGTKINGTAISSVSPYVFNGASFGNTSISIDMSDCVNPLTPGSYNAVIKTYACTDAAAPRGGWLLASGSTAFTVESPSQYAIRITAPPSSRVFDKSVSAIPVIFNIQTLGSGTVKSTLQRKYGEVYVNISGQTDLPVSISGGSATLTIPPGYDKGTYRFALTLYDNNNTARAQAVESVIIK